MYASAIGRDQRLPSAMPYNYRTNGANRNGFDNNGYEGAIENDHDPNVVQCCVPTSCDNQHTIRTDGDMRGVVKVVCNNEQCTEGVFMHADCFDAWEESVLTYLRSCGRARSWSEKQRLQNLWTKKGYDLAFKACSCKCGKGHLRKDLDWIPPKAKVNIINLNQPRGEKKAKKNNKKNERPSLGVSIIVAPQPNQQQPQTPGGESKRDDSAERIRTYSMSSTGSGSSSGVGSSIGRRNSSPSSGAETPSSPSRTLVQPFVGSAGNGGGTGARRKSAGNKFEFFTDCNGSIFSRRLDFDTFSNLPRYKMNSYHIKMDDDGNHGNDETRNFVLTNLATSRTTRTECILCENTMIIFERYPLVDGTFFLSPRQYTKSCMLVRVDGRNQYLSAVCMSCLEGWSCQLQCKFCSTPWDGSNLILGTMYSYDIMAANPCCPERLRCNYCHNLVIPLEQRLPFFSDYSHPIDCASCHVPDFHFVKPLATYRMRSRHVSTGQGSGKED